MYFLFRRRFQNGDRRADMADHAGPAAEADLFAAWAAARDLHPGSPSPGSHVLDDRETRPSHRTLLAAALLREGDDVDWVCEVTGVPVALLELIRDENTPSECLHGVPPVGKARLRFARMAIVLVVALELAAAANLIVYLSALIQHRPAVAVLTGLLEAVLITALWASIRVLAPRLGVPDPYRPHPKLAMRHAARLKASRWRRPPPADKDKRRGNAA